MTVKNAVSLFREKFPDLEIGQVRRIDEWYVFSIANAPKEKIADREVAFDPYIAYNTKTNVWDSVNPLTFGGHRFFGAKPIPFE